VTHAVHATRDMVISGGKEGKVKFWTVDLMQCLKEVVISHPNAVGSCIKSMHLSGSMLLLGTRSGEIYEMDTTSYSHELLLQGHGYGTIWGLATHPSEHQMVTVGDDCTVRVWDLAARRMVMVRDLGARGRSAAYHPDGSQIAIGLAGGGLVVLSADSLDTVHAKKDREEPIHEVKYSPNGQFLAAGSHDNYIDVYDVSKQYGRMGVCKGHASFVRHVDWSTDSTILQSNSGDFEQMFWEVPSGKHIAFPADARNVDWATWTCVAGWPVQGIMPRYSMGADVLSCDRSHTRTIVAAGDAYGCLKLFQYPAHKGAAGRTFGGHSSKVTQVRFTFDDMYVITVGADMTIMQWRLVL
jgi:microtubule-associated protein-like 6